MRISDWSSDVCSSDLALSLRARFHQPAIAETFLPGREFTVGVVGNGPTARAVAAMEIVLLQNADPEIYSFENKELCESRVANRLADDPEAQAAAAPALAAYRTLGCRDGRPPDLRSDSAGAPQFPKVNPLAGLHS